MDNLKALAGDIKGIYVQEIVLKVLTLQILA
jgi:hypothetical protein